MQDITVDELPRIDEQQKREKQHAGRYTLREAAQMLEQHIGERADDMLQKLMQAVRDDLLPVHEPGRQAQYWPKKIRGFYEEAYWDDLNTWLTQNEIRITWRFPEPEIEQTQREPDGNAKTGETKANILAGKWPYEGKFSEGRLKSAMENGYKWIEDARVGQPGARGQGSHKWNPAMMAQCVMNQYGLQARRFDIVIRNDYPEWLEEWERLKEDFF